MTLSVRALLADNPDLACSGGAIGSDTEWGTAALAAGHNVLHFGFEGHHSAAPGTHVQLNAAQLAAAHPHVRAANRTLDRVYPMRSGFNNALLRRNWYQIRRSKGLYATAPLAPDARTVEGGTGWAVQMWLDAGGGARPTWVWCTRASAWYRWHRNRFVLDPRPPRPRGIYAAIGTRYPPASAVGAIHQLYGFAA